MGRFVVRKDHSHAVGMAGYSGDLSPDLGHMLEPGLDLRVARVVGERKRVLIFGGKSAALCRALQARDCRTVVRAIDTLNAIEGEGRPPSDQDRDDARFDSVVLADILGHAHDPRAVLRGVKEQLRPDGSLVVTLGRITAIDGWLAMVDSRPLGAGSGVLFTADGLIGLLEDSEFAIGHIEGVDSPQAPDVNRAVRDGLIVAYPLPGAGMNHLQRRIRALAQQGQEALREASVLQRQSEVSESRLAMLAGNEQRMAARIQELRARLLEAHAQMIRGDDEMRKTFGDAIYQRNALLIERDILAGQRDALVAERVNLDALLEECRGLRNALDSAERRLDLLRKSPLGLAYRALRKLFPRRGGGAIRQGFDNG